MRTKRLGKRVGQRERASGIVLNSCMHRLSKTAQQRYREIFIINVQKTMRRDRGRLGWVGKGLKCKGWARPARTSPVQVGRCQEEDLLQSGANRKQVRAPARSAPSRQALHRGRVCRSWALSPPAPFRAQPPGARCTAL